MTAFQFLTLVAIFAGLYFGAQLCLGFDASRFDDDGRS